MTKTNLTYAFAQMRKQGLLAQMNFLCCSKCGGLAFRDQAVRLKEKGVLVKGCCFYTKQDNNYKRQGMDFYLNYGPLDTADGDTIGLGVEDVGMIVARCLQMYGVEFIWDGDPNKRIKVKNKSIKPLNIDDAAKFTLPKKVHVERTWWSKYSVN